MWAFERLLRDTKQRQCSLTVDAGGTVRQIGLNLSAVLQGSIRGQRPQGFNDAKLLEQWRPQVVDDATFYCNAFGQGTLQTIDSGEMGFLRVVGQFSGNPVRIEFGGREQGAELVVKLPSQSRFLVFARVGNVACEIA
ncbi:MAG: hypothetical protein DVS81_14240 [Candidatus Accumulibacter meliphilus]|uniref:Uncharacterized protein n=1 Tax=Candidatus Accumulibacter meliphilus TaxID=2211374 RepID=A0A369XR72_9PROT|nr:MAG: hypothetical protein DVS81_14240 [Candidatus Accumulibacter meliphilus]